MRVMVIVKASKASEAGEFPTTEQFAEMGRFNEALVEAGIICGPGEGLHPSATGKRVRFSGATRTVIDGPFAQPNELIAGFWLWNVKSMEEAVEWVKRCPNPMIDDSEIEIRRVFEAEDFGEAFTPELREQEAVLRAKTLGLSAPDFRRSPALIVAGLLETYDTESRVKIPGQWERFAKHIGKVPGQVGSDSYGVCVTASADCSFEYLTGVAVSSTEKLPDGFESVALDDRRYAVFNHAGHVSTLVGTIETIWCKWAPESGLPLERNAPCFERYTEEFNPSTGLGGMEIWIPLAFENR